MRHIEYQIVCQGQFRALQVIGQRVIGAASLLLVIRFFSERV